MQYFIGNYGPDRIILVDPTESDSFRLIQLPTRRVHFVVDPVRAKFAYVFTEDGKLNQIDVLKGEISQSVRVTDPYSMDGHWNDPRPRIAVADNKIYVTDPLKSKIIVLDATSFKRPVKLASKGSHLILLQSAVQEKYMVNITIMKLIIMMITLINTCQT